VSKSYNDEATGPTKKFDDIFIRMDTVHQRDRQTDGRTPGDCKDRIYAQRRAEKILSKLRKNKLVKNHVPNKRGKFALNFPRIGYMCGNVV